MANPRGAGNHRTNTDSLIRDDRSDGGSSYAESPADGYFAERSHPRDVYVANPSMTQDSKASEESSGPGAHSPLSSPAVSLRSRSYSVESLPILDAGPAPPDYAAATASRNDTHQSAPYRDNARHSARPSMESRTSYGSTDHAQPNTEGADNRQSHMWPLGNANNPFGPGFPFANTNNPFGPGFPFGNGSNPFGPGFPFNNNSQANLSGNHRNVPPDHEPQDMRDRVPSPESSHEQTGLLRWNPQPQRKRKSWLSRSPCKLKSLLTIGIAIAIIVLIISIAKSARDPGEARSGDGSDKNREGTTPTVPSPGDDSRKPPQAPKFPPPPHAPSSECPLDHHTDTAAFAFQDPGSFLFVEAIEAANVTTFNGNVWGDLHIRPAQDDQQSDIVLYLSIGTTDPWEISSLDYVQTENSFFLNMPNLKQNDISHSARACMEINALIEVREGVRLDDLMIEVNYLNIIIEEGLFSGDQEGTDGSHFYVKNLANFSSVSGDISSAYWSSRDTIVRTGSGDITGNYALLDTLGVYSTSGTVKINVDPQEVDKEKPEPADFEATTVSGDVQVTFPSSGKIPERLYKTRVETTSADVRGSYILGRKSSFRSVSGDVNIKLLPFYREDASSQLETSSFSSTTKVNVLSPYERSGKPWRQLQHSGSSASGDLQLTYPPEWEGHIDVLTVSGSINVRGNVQKITEDRKPWKNHFKGVKGKGDAALGFQTTSGDIRVIVAD